jgi:thiamine biosynthesis lipoprotein
VQTAQHYSQLSEGAFDITIGPLVNLWGIGKKEEVPSQAAIDSTKVLIDYRKLQIGASAGTIGLPEMGMSIDLGAIAKGYAGDEAARIFKEYGVKNGIISLGGNVVVVGTRPDGKPWRVGIQNPFKPIGNYAAVVEETDKTVVTSGTYERYFIKDGKRYHHILDPSTGYPADNGLASVSIIADKSIDADALSTTVFLLGPEKGMGLVDDLPNVECIMITNDKKITVSSGLQDKINITDEDFVYEEGR